MVRQDPILNDAIASDGDVRRLVDLLGISIATAERYVDVILEPNERDLSEETRRQPLDLDIV